MYVLLIAMPIIMIAIFNKQGDGEMGRERGREIDDVVSTPNRLSDFI